MMEIPIHIAIDPWHFSVYDTGKPDRTERLIIRVRGEDGEGSKNAKAFNDIQDTSQAGQSFSAQELNLERAQIEDLAVIVGERLDRKGEEDTAKKTLATIEKDIEEPLRTQDPQKVQIVVRRVQDAKSNLFILVKKKQEDGLCSLSQIPAGDHSTYFYREWTNFDRETSGQSQERLRVSTNLLNEFCSSFRQSRLGTPNAGTELANQHQESSCTQDRAQALLSELTKSVAFFGHSANPEIYNHMLYQIDTALGRSRTTIEDAGGWDVIKNLITGQESFDKTEAREAVEAYQGLWSVITPSDLPEAVTEQALFSLATGLRDGVLWDDPILQEDKYGLFISIFCTNMEDVDFESLSVPDRNHAIRTAYKAARRSPVSDIDPTIVPEATMAECTNEALMVEMEENVKIIQLIIDSMSDRITSISKQHSSHALMSPTDRGLAEEIRGLLNAATVSSAREHIDQIIHYFSLQEKSSLSNYRELLIAARANATKRLQMLCTVRSQNELDENEFSEDEVDSAEKSNSGSDKAME